MIEPSKREMEIANAKFLNINLYEDFRPQLAQVLAEYRMELVEAVNKKRISAILDLHGNDENEANYTGEIYNEGIDNAIKAIENYGGGE